LFNVFFCLVDFFIICNVDVTKKERKRKRKRKEKKKKNIVKVYVCFLYFFMYVIEKKMNLIFLIYMHKYLKDR